MGEEPFFLAGIGPRGRTSMDAIMEGVRWLRDALQRPLISAGSTEITLWSVAYFVLSAALRLWLAARVQRWLTQGPLLKSRLDPSARHAIGALVRYVLLVIGLLVILQTAGIDLTTFNVLAGAVGIGIGFGLQNVVSNFIAGLIIMFERPIKIG